MEHFYTQSSKINFAKLEERLLQINDTEALTNFQFSRKLHSLLKNISTLIMATGGFKAVAHFLKMFLENNGVICEVIEPRDYFYKTNVNNYKRLIGVSNSGKSNGILALRIFKGETILITGEYDRQENDAMKIIYYSNKTYLDNKEKSFISIIPTLAPMLMFLELNNLLEEGKSELNIEDYKRINEKLKILIKKSKDSIDLVKDNFKDTSIIQVMSGYETKVSASILESNLIETGICSVVIHDKGSFCHGRSNLFYQYPNSYMIYLTHNINSFDKLLIDTLQQEYLNVSIFNTEEIDDNIYWKEYYLSLQMYYLSKKIAKDKNIDLTIPEYNPRLVKKLYNYRGEM